MKAINAIFACMLSVSVPTFAESNFNPSINIDLQTRVSYLNDRIDNHIRHDASGFKGDYFLLSVSGQVTDRLTYSWRQRINQKKERSDRFDGTDWVCCLAQRWLPMVAVWSSSPQKESPMCASVWAYLTPRAPTATHREH